MGNAEYMGYEEAKHLDSVTDHVQEQEFDASKAKDAMTALAIKPGGSDVLKNNVKKRKVILSKEDVSILVSELEILEDRAERALREVAEEGTWDHEEKGVLKEALRRLIVGTS